MTIDRAEEILEELIEELPEKIFDHLNGGVLLLEDERLSPNAVDNDLYIMGEYCVNTAMGRMVKIYYGSLVKLYGEDISDARCRKKLRKVLHHELTHHLEHMCGDRGLEIEDERRLRKYKEQHGVDD